MSRLSTRLRKFIEPAKKQPDPLLPEERRVYRSIKTESTRATKGRQIRSCRFESKNVENGVELIVALEGKDASCVAKQVARRFGEMGEVTTSEVERQGRGYNAVICMERTQQ